MGYKRPKRKNDYGSLYDAAISGIPMTKQALTLLGDELQAEEEQNEHELKKLQIADTKIRYAMDKYGYAHDKDCERILAYPYKDLRWMADAGVNIRFCNTCYRKALIRRALSEKEMKRIDDYVSFFERHKTSNYMLKELFLLKNMKIRLLGPDILWVKTEEDEWKVEYDYSVEEYILWHNSYEIIGKKRHLTGDFHIQGERTHKCFGYVINMINNYSNKFHLEKKSEISAQADKKLNEHIEDVKKEQTKEASAESVSKPVCEDEPPIGSFAYFDRLLAMSR